VELRARTVILTVLAFPHFEVFMEINENYVVVDLEMKVLYHDESFNCRGPISPIDVADLAKSLDKHGLQFPITVQPKADVEGGLPDGCDFRIIAGHRRHKAAKVLGWMKIPAMIRRGLTEAQARILNLGENLNRKELNILQEAHALEALEKAGVPRDTVAKELQMSSSWVQVRYYLLRMPDEIQQEAAAGILNQYQIKQLYSLDNHEQMFEAVRKIKEAKVRGEAAPEVGKRKKQSIATKKARKRAEIFAMIDLLAETLGYDLTTRALAWTSGEITTAEFFADVEKLAKEKGKPFTMPLEF
jgi:ParB family transcriptional regulator, chromosome partitioning protein